MSTLHILIETHWQQPKAWLSVLLWPLSRLFQAIAVLRLLAYRSGWKSAQRLPCPVVVVGNIHVGGVGKTPIVAALVNGLQARGLKVGIVSRGYGRHSREILLVNEHSSAADAGDEPLMLWRQTGVPVAVGGDRFQAGCLLLQAYPQTNLVICDDGLQHHALARDMEIVVFPAADVGRRLLDVLPNGPLREPVSRLRTVDAVVVSQGDNTIAARCRDAAGLPETMYCGYSRVQAGRVYALADPQQRLVPADCAGKTVAALAAIARPQRFFETLRAQGWPLAQTMVLPDHARIEATDLPLADVVLITEKDAVKLLDQHWPQVWVLPIIAEAVPDLADAVCAHLDWPSQPEPTISPAVPAQSLLQ